MRGAPDPIRLGGLAATVGGAMWVAKGGLIMQWIVELGELLIVAELFFAVGMAGLHAQLEGQSGRTGSVGGLPACATVACSVVNAPYSLFFAEDGPRTLFSFNITYLLGTLALFVGLVLLGIAAWLAWIFLGYVLWSSVPGKDGLG